MTRCPQRETSALQKVAWIRVSWEIRCTGSCMYMILPTQVLSLCLTICNLISIFAYKLKIHHNFTNKAYSNNSTISFTNFYLQWGKSWPMQSSWKKYSPWRGKRMGCGGCIRCWQSRRKISLSSMQISLFLKVKSNILEPAWLFFKLIAKMPTHTNSKK